MLTDKNQLAQGLTDIQATDIIRLVYASRPTLSSRLSTGILEDIQIEAQQYNQDNNITGVLCFGNGYFFQCLEGERDKVEPLMGRIFADKRHKKVTILMAKLIDRPHFSDWRMRSLSLDPRLWADTSLQAQSEELKGFLPFEPMLWTDLRIERFLQLMQSFERLSNQGNGKVTFNKLGQMIGHTISQHHAFLFVQGMIALCAIMLLFTVL